MSSKSSFSGSEGRTRMSCVILQRRLPRRSVRETGCLGKFLLGVFSSSDRAGSPRVNHLSGETSRSIREECNPGATTKPIAETYPRTFQENGSTEVLQTEGRGVENGAEC